MLTITIRNLISKISKARIGPLIVFLAVYTPIANASREDQHFFSVTETLFFQNFKSSRILRNIPQHNHTRC